jgi:SAM-dependent methyltransferase
MFPVLPVNTLTELESHILQKGSLSPEGNKETFDKWFKPGPRRRTLETIRRNKLDQQSVVDIGSGFGNNLAYLGEGSYGLEIKPEKVDFTNSIGLTAHCRNVVSDDVSGLPKVDNAIAWAVMEHVDSPHVFLRKIHSLLNPGGRIFVFVPTIPLIPPRMFPNKFRRYWRGHLHWDHINAFSRDSLRFTCERAGFETESCSPGFFGATSFLNHVPGVQSLLDGSLYIGKSIPDWQYHESSIRKDNDSYR